jgi:hypothetical protein
VLIAVLAGMYRLRRYARAELIYNRLRHSEPSTESRATGQGAYSTGDAYRSRLIRDEAVPPAAGSANLRSIRASSASDASGTTAGARHADRQPALHRGRDRGRRVRSR